MKCILIFWGVPPEIRQMAEPRGRAMRGFRLRRRLRRSSDPLAFLAAPTIPHPARAQAFLNRLVFESLNRLVVELLRC